MAYLSLHNTHVMQAEGIVLSNEQLAMDVYVITLELQEIASLAVPGQFLNIRVNPSFQPLLRRPMSIHRVDTRLGEVEIIYKVIGLGTKTLSAKQARETVDCIGPLGNGFRVPEAEKLSIIVAGGIGVAPLVFLAEKLLKERYTNVIFLIGATSQDYVFYENGLRRLGAEVHVSTDNGSYGHRGFVTELLEREIEKLPMESDKVSIYACGPEPMLKRTSQIARQYEITCQLCLETYMACGIGVCQGCPVPINSGFQDKTEYKLVCVDGPVFDAREVVFKLVE